MELQNPNIIVYILNAKECSLFQNSIGEHVRVALKKSCTLQHLVKKLVFLVNIGHGVLCIELNFNLYKN